MIAGLRNHLVHGYFSVDSELLWVAVTVEVPGLARTVHGWATDGGVAGSRKPLPGFRFR